MRTLAVIAAFLACTVGNAVAQSGEFRGNLCLTFSNDACQANGWTAGSCLQVRYRPPGVANNGENTRLSVFAGNVYAANYTKNSAGGIVGSAYQPVQGTGIGSGGFQFPAFLRFTAQAPASPTETTNFINFFGNIARFDNIDGCLVSFRGAVANRPDNP